MKGIIYYTHHKGNPKILKAARKTIEFSGLPIVSCSLKPMDFGKNIVLDLKPCAATMFKQILACLQNSESEYVFFCEHDVLYHPSHFRFTPPLDYIYYYNTNVWRWDFPQDRLIGYDGLRSLSGMCVNRKLALNHYYARIKLMEKKGWDKDTKRDPRWARVIGYEPGKTKKRGGFMNEQTENWNSEFPIIDIRHNQTVTKPKVTLDSFKHQPTGWKEIKLNELEGWTLENFQF